MRTTMLEVNSPAADELENLFFTPVYDWLWRRPDLTSDAKVLYSRLAHRCTRGTTLVVASEQWAGEQLGVKGRRARQVVAELREAGLIVRAGRGQFLLPDHPWMDAFDGAFLRLPDWLLQCPDLTTAAKLLWCRLEGMAAEGVVKPRQSWMATELGLSERTARRCVAELRKLRLLTVRQRGNSLSNVYLVTPRPALSGRSHRHDLAGPTGTIWPVQREDVLEDVLEDAVHRPTLARLPHNHVDNMHSAEENDHMREVKADGYGDDEEAPAHGADRQVWERAATKSEPERTVRGARQKPPTAMRVAMRLQRRLEANKQDIPPILRDVNLKALARNLSRKTELPGIDYARLQAAADLFADQPTRYVGNRDQVGWRAFLWALDRLLADTQGSVWNEPAGDVFADAGKIVHIEVEDIYADAGRIKTAAEAGW